MTSDPQIGFNWGNSGGGRPDGDTNAMNTYAFLVSQIKRSSCPQTVVGIAGDINFESNGYENNFHHDAFAAGDKSYFFADLLGNHDLLQITSKYSMIPAAITSNPFYWPNAISIPYQFPLPAPFSGYTSVSANPSTTYYTHNNANYYVLGLYNKNSANTSTPPVAYYVAIHNNFDDGLPALNKVKAWYSNLAQNYKVPIILASHWVDSSANGPAGTTNLYAFVQSLPVAAILVGHRQCSNTFHNDHCSRRDTPYELYYTGAVNSNGKSIPSINTNGVRDRIFFSISLNSTTVQIIRKTWTNGGRYGDF